MPSESARKLSQGDEEASRDDDSIAYARLSSFKIDAEPRLTAMVAYDPAPSMLGHTREPQESLALVDSKGSGGVKKRKTGDESKVTTKKEKRKRTTTTMEKGEKKAETREKDD